MRKFKFFIGLELHVISDSWSNIAFPMIRRVFANTIGQDLVAVQPLSAPSGLLFYMDYQYGSVDDQITTFKFFRGLPLMGINETIRSRNVGGLGGHAGEQGPMGYQGPVGYDGYNFKFFRNND